MVLGSEKSFFWKQDLGTLSRNSWKVFFFSFFFLKLKIWQWHWIYAAPGRAWTRLLTSTCETTDVPQDKGLYDHGSLNPARSSDTTTYHHTVKYQSTSLVSFFFFFLRTLQAANLLFADAFKFFFPAPPLSSLCVLRQSEWVVLTGGTIKCKWRRTTPAAHSKVNTQHRSGCWLHWATHTSALR